MSFLPRHLGSLVNTTKYSIYYIFFTTLFLAGCDIDFANESKVTIMDPTPPTFAEIIEPKLDDNPDKIWGAFTNDEAIKSLASLPDAVEYETVFLLAGTNYKKDGHENFIYSKYGKNGLPLNMDVVEKLEKSNFFYDLGEVGSGSVWAGESMRAMANFFPNANFVLINIGEGTPTEKAEALATVISQKIPQNSLIISLLNYESGSERPIADWQEQYFEEAITNIKCANAENMPIKNETLFKVFQHIMRDLGALEFKENGFIKGEGVCEGTVYLNFFGDIMLGRYVRTLMDRNSMDYPFELMDNDYLKVNDLLIANLEGPVTDNAMRTSKGIAFQFKTDVVPLLKKYHFDVVSLANNHTYDMGQQGFDDSFKYLPEGGIVPFGDPREINEKSVAKFEIKGQKIAFLGLEEVVFDINDQAAVQSITELTEQGYKVIPVIHWGIEYTPHPNKRQRDLAHKFIDAGAIAIIAHHPHVVQEYEEYNGRPIFYSLGNAVFDQYFSAATQEGLSLAMQIDSDRLTLNLVPFKINRSQMVLMTPDQQQEFLNRMASWNKYPSEIEKQIKSGKIILTF